MSVDTADPALDFLDPGVTAPPWQHSVPAEILPAAHDNVRKPAIKKLSWWHESIIDWMLSNPDKFLGDCAAYFRVSQPWLSQVINSHAFKERYAQRRQEHFEGVSQDIRDSVSGLAEMGLDILKERIARERDTLSVNVLKDTTEMALKALGFGGPRPQGGQVPSVQVNVAVSSDALAEARARMRAANTPPALEASNGQVSPAPALPPGEQPL